MKPSDRHLLTRAYGRALPYALLALALLVGPGCAVPVFSDFQTARVVQRGEWEVTPAVSHLPSLEQTNAGLQAAMGIGSNVEVRARYTRAFTRDLSEELDTRFFDDLGGDFSTAGFGVKVGLIDGALAAYLPIEVVFDALASTVMTRPTLIATVPLTRFAEVNASVNAILPRGLVSVNAGLGLGNLGTWSVRPEAGVMLNTGYVSVGVGLAYRLGGPN